MKKIAFTRDQAIREIIDVFATQLMSAKTDIEVDYNFWNSKSDKNLIETLQMMYANKFVILPDNDTTKILYGVDK